MMCIGLHNSRILAPIYANLAAESDEPLRHRVYCEVNPVDCQAPSGASCCPLAVLFVGQYVLGERLRS